MFTIAVIVHLFVIKCRPMEFIWVWVTVCKLLDLGHAGLGHAELGQRDWDMRNWDSGTGTCGTGTAGLGQFL